MAVKGAPETITRTVLSWPGMTSHPHPFGGVEYRLHGREIGHTHSEELVDILVPARVRDELIAAGRAERHQIVPHMGVVSCWLRAPEDVQRAIELLRLSYDLVAGRRA